MAQGSSDLQKLLKELKAEYLASFPLRIERLRQFTSSKNWPDLTEEYHKLKGTGKTYGFPEISTISERLEWLGFQLQENPQKFSELGFHENDFEKFIYFFDELKKCYDAGVSVDFSKDPLFQKIMALPVQPVSLKTRETK